MNDPSSRAAAVLAHLARLASREPARLTIERLLHDPTPLASFVHLALPRELLEAQLRLAGVDDAQLASFHQAGLGAPQLEEILYAHRDALHAVRLLAAHHATSAAPHESGPTEAHGDHAPDEAHRGSTRLAALLDGCPLPFGARSEFDAFVGELGDALRESLGEIPEGSVRMIGTSTTLFSLNPGKSPDHRFDEGQRSDIDLAIESPALSRWLGGRGASVEGSRINAGGTILGLHRWMPSVAAWQARWGAALGRAVGVVATGDGGARRWPSVMDVAVSLRGEPCQCRPRG